MDDLAPDDLRPGVRALAGAFDVFSADQMQLDSPPAEEGSAGWEVAKVLLDGGMLLDHLLSGFELLFWKVLHAAAVTRGLEPEVLLHRVSLSVAQESESLQRTQREGGAFEKSAVTAAEAAAVLVSFFAVERQLGEDDFATTFVFDDMNVLLSQPSGLEAIVRGAIRVVEVTYDWLLYSQALAFAARRGDAADPPTQAQDHLVRGVASQTKGVGLKGVSDILKGAIGALPPPPRQLRLRPDGRAYDFTGFTPEEIPELLAESREAHIQRFRPILQTTVDMLGSILEVVDWEGSEGSPLSADRGTLSEPAASDALDSCLRLARLSAYGTRDHARTLQLLLGLDGGVLGPSVIARAALEAAARSCWLLGNDVAGVARIERTFAYRYATANWASKSSAALEVFYETPEDVVRDAAVAGIEYKRGEMCEKGRMSGQKSTGETAAVLELLKGQSPAVQAASYALLSEIAHSRPRGNKLLEVGDDLRRSATTSPVHTEAVLSHATSVTCFSVVKAFDRLFDYVGVDRPDWSHWRRYVHSQLQEVSRRRNKPT